MAAELRKVSGKSDRGVSVSRSKGGYMRRGAGRRCPMGRGGPRPRPRPHPWVGPAPAPGVAPLPGLLAPWLILLKNPFSNFSGIFRELFNPAQKKDTKCNSAEYSVSSG